MAKHRVSFAAAGLPIREQGASDSLLHKLINGILCKVIVHSRLTGFGVIEGVKVKLMSIKSVFFDC